MNYIKIFKLAVKQIFFVFIISTFCGSMALAGTENAALQQDVTITGTVTADNDNMGLPGVSVVVKGSPRGTVTDINGKYTIAVPSNAVLVFSSVGYRTQEIAVEGRTIIDLIMNEEATQLEEVVVTALGITRQEKSLGYSVGKLGGAEMVKVPQENLLNALAGKVSGVQINSTGGTGSSVSMVIRGATSLFSDNQPLFVIDGVPVSNTLNNMTQFGNQNVVDYGNAISDLNAEDIESISVLKGPSAAALYGSRAGSGVVVVTTKSGKKNTGLRVDVSSNTVFDVPYRFFEIQDRFANGTQPVTQADLPANMIFEITPNVSFGCGPEVNKGFYAIQWNGPVDANGQPIPTEVVGYPNNIRNFVQIGITSTNSISVSNNNERINYRIGVTNMSNKGMIPGSDLYRNNISTAASVNLAKNVTLSSNINYAQSWSNNRPAGDRGTNPMQHAYKVPLNSDIRTWKNYWEPGMEGFKVFKPSKEYENPYFLAHEVKNSFQRDRVFGNLTLEWKILPKLTAMGRFTMDKTWERRETKIPPGFEQEPNNGTYGLYNSTNYERNVDFSIRWDDRVGDFSYTLSLGGNEMYTKYVETQSSASSGTGLVVPGVYTLKNIESGKLSYKSSWTQKAIQSIFAFANLGWKDMVYLDLTARNDWSSTLPKNNRSYFYPSASLSLLIDQMFDLGYNVSLVKLRGGWAQVGKDTNPYQLVAMLSNKEQWGNAMRYEVPGTLLSPNLKPELATSIEFGTDLGFYDNRIRFEGTYFVVDNANQIIQNVPDPFSSGFRASNVNLGLTQSKGWEFTVGGTPIKNNSWIWDINVNLTKTRVKLLKLAPGIERIQFWSTANATSWARIGETVGDLFDRRILAVEDKNSEYYGFPIISYDDYEWQQVPEADGRHKIGSYNPNFILGLNSNLSYKNFSLSWTLDWRCGGHFVSQTERYIREDGFSKTHLYSTINPGDRSPKELRDWLVANKDKYIKDGFHVVGGATKELGGFYHVWPGHYPSWDGCFVPGVYVENVNGVETYVENLGEDGTRIYPYGGTMPWGFARPTTFPSDYVKLREISLTYQIPQNVLNKIGGIKGCAVSVYSRNIMLWTKAKIGVDPERAFQPQGDTGGSRGTQFMQGIERYNLEPWPLPIGVKLNVTF